VTELRLVTILGQAMREQGFEVWYEVPVSWLGRCDIVGRRDGRYWAVEAKLSNWCEAWRQASPHLLVVDYAVIAMPNSTAHRGLSQAKRDMLKLRGGTIQHRDEVGLWGVAATGDWEELRAPLPSQEVTKHGRDLLVRRLAQDHGYYAMPGGVLVDELALYQRLEGIE